MYVFILLYIILCVHCACLWVNSHAYELCIDGDRIIASNDVNVIGEQQAIDLSSNITAFFSTELKWVIFV